MKRIRTCNGGCGSREILEDRGIPSGWFSLMQSDPNGDGKLIGLGIFCSLECLTRTLGKG
jgi:hypothetical protein